MCAELMRPEEVPGCRWLGFTLIKGVTNPHRAITAQSTGGDDLSGAHGRLVQQFGGVDSTPECYNPQSKVGFGGFVRWVRFLNPTGGQGVFGLDWSLNEPPHIGVATSALEVALVASLVRAFGVPGGDELVLLTPRMTELPIMEQWRHREGLICVGDWADAPKRFHSGTGFCPKCGQWTFICPSWRYCHQCGADPHHVWRAYGLEE